MQSVKTSHTLPSIYSPLPPLSIYSRLPPRGGMQVSMDGGLDYSSMWRTVWDDVLISG